jgi:hypothetical protein
MEQLNLLAQLEEEERRQKQKKQASRPGGRPKVASSYVS